MLTGRSFRLRSETIAIATLDGKRTVVMLPAGSRVVVTSGPTPDEQRMVEVEWESRLFVLFLVDLQERGTEVFRKAAASG